MSARKRLEQLVDQSPDEILVVAVERFSLDKQKAPLDLWRASSSLSSKICLALTLASSGPTETETVEIERLVGELLDTGVPAFIVLGLDIPCILGDEKLRQRMLDRAAESVEIEQDTHWVTKILQYHKGEITAKEWIEYASPYSNELCLAHHVIGMKALFERDTETAKNHLRLASGYPIAGHWAFHCSRCYTQKLDAGWVPSKPREP